MRVFCEILEIKRNICQIDKFSIFMRKKEFYGRPEMDMD